MVEPMEDIVRSIMEEVRTHTHLPVHSSPLSIYIDYYQGDYSGRGYGYGGGRGGKLSVCGCACIV